MAKDVKVYGFGRSKASALNKLATKQLVGNSTQGISSPEDFSHTEPFFAKIIADIGPSTGPEEPISFGYGTATIYKWDRSTSKLVSTGVVDDIYNPWMDDIVLADSWVIGRWIDGLRIIIAPLSCDFLG